MATERYGHLSADTQLVRKNIKESVYQTLKQ